MIRPNVLTRRELIHRATRNLAGAGCAATFSGLAAAAGEKSSDRTIPAVPGTLELQWRRRARDGGRFRVINETVQWNASETAIIVCDMWADHPCKLAAMRVGRMAPRMNEVISLARDHGVAVIHAPSGGMKHYQDTPLRQRMKNAHPATPPVPIQGWCHLNPEHEGPWPIVDDVRRGEARVVPSKTLRPMHGTFEPFFRQAIVARFEGLCRGLLVLLK